MMTAPTVNTIKRLFAVSHNRCAFPKCKTPLVEKTETITCHICHIKAASIGGPRFDELQDEKDRNSYGNLILMCSRHHTIIDNEAEKYTVDRLIKFKKEHEKNGLTEIGPRIAELAERLLNSYKNTIIIQNRDGQIALNSPGVIQAKTLRLETVTRKIKILPPDDAIASDLKMRTYAKYLIERYNEFQKGHKEKEGTYKYAVIYKAIKREFGCNWDMVPKEKCSELFEYLQRRIDKTKIGRTKKSHGSRTYHSYEEHFAGKRLTNEEGY